MPTLGGNVVIRNGNSLDFCWRESIRSLLPVCDVVSVSDGESTDGTQEEIREWMKSEPKIVLNVYPWPSPKGNPDWFVAWLNYNREHVKADWQFQLDGDEVLHEKSYDEILRFIQTPNRTGIVTRFNFWKDHHHLIPEGYCCGKKVVRLAPQSLWLASDGEHPRGAEAASLAVPTGVEIFHYGFIRQREKFFEKERLLQGYFFDTYDPRLEAAEKHEGNWMAKEGVTGWESNLDPFSGTHPAAAMAWLKERGYA